MRAIFVAGVALVLFSASAARAEIINGAFEDGLNGWTKYTWGLYSSASTEYRDASNGYCALLQISTSTTVGSEAELMQDVAINAGDVLSFDYKTSPIAGNDYTAHGSLQVYDPTTYETVFSDIFTGSDWSSYSTTFASDHASAEIMFITEDVLQLDNVSLAPEPGTLTLLATGLVGLLTYAWRKRT